MRRRSWGCPDEETYSRRGARAPAGGVSNPGAVRPGTHAASRRHAPAARGGHSLHSGEAHAHHCAGRECGWSLGQEAIAITSSQRSGVLVALLLIAAAAPGLSQHLPVEVTVFADPLEADSLAAWEANACTVESATDIVQQGSACLKLTDQGGNAQAFMRLATTPGLRYRVQVSAWRHASNSGDWLGCAAVSFAGGRGSSSSYASRSEFIPVADQWCDLALEFEAATRRAYVILVGQNATGDVTRFDNLRVTCIGIPEVTPAMTDDAQRVPAITGVELVGSPAQIGERWGALNREAIQADMDEHYLVPAEEAGLTRAELLQRSEKFVARARDYAPHWLEETDAIATAAGVDPDLYLAYVGSVYRGIWRGEDCTSYAVAPEYAGGRIFFHKNRDNVPKRQCAFVIGTERPGINKFIAVSDASVVACMMMVNEKGLAGSADVGGLPVEEPRYRGWMNTSLLRHIAERASDCAEALAIIAQFVGDGDYAGGTWGTHWLFVDREGAILEVSNNSTRVEHHYHTEKAYMSASRGPASTRLQVLTEPVGFGAFHNVSRDPATCFPTSISGMSVEIDRDHPDFLTVAWITMPARSLAFPLFMGGTDTPQVLLNGEVDLAGRQSDGDFERWEPIEAFAFETQRLLAADVRRLLAAGETEHARAVLDGWVAGCSRAHLSALGWAGAPAAADAGAGGQDDGGAD